MTIQSPTPGAAMTVAISTQPPRRTRVASGLAAIAQGAAVVGGLPYALVRYVGSPLPARWPSITEVRTAVELRDFARAHLAHFKVPSEFHFLSELPKTATGKIQKFVLRGRRAAIAAQ